MTLEFLQKKAAQIRLLVLDVDGIMTNGLIYYGDNDTQRKAFYIQDGIGIKLLQHADIEVAIISGKVSRAVDNRLKELKISHCYTGYDDKRPAYEALKTKLNIQDHEIAYMGDDLPDLPLLSVAGLAATVPEAPLCVREACDLITQKKGGNGAVREVCEFILHAQARLQTVIQSFINP